MYKFLTIKVFAIINQNRANLKIQEQTTAYNPIIFITKQYKKAHTWIIILIWKYLELFAIGTTHVNLKPYFMYFMWTRFNIKQWWSTCMHIFFSQKDLKAWNYICNIHTYIWKDISLVYCRYDANIQKLSFVQSNLCVSCD